MDTERYSVLIVDDKTENIFFLREILKDEYTVYSAKDGNTAMKLAARHMPDVMFVDLIMPEMDGYALISLVKQTKETAHIPIIIITGLNDSINEEKGLSIGAADFVTKPFSPTVIKLRLKNQIDILKQLHTIKQQLENMQSLEYVNVKNMLDSTPQPCLLWNKNMEIMDCNEASMKLFNVTSKKDFIRRFFDFSPKAQPNRELSVHMVSKAIKTAFVEGKAVFYYTFNTLEGHMLPCNITLVRINLQSDDLVVAYIEDLREHDAMANELKHQDNLLYTVSQVAEILLQSSIEHFEKDMYDCMGMMAVAVDADRVYIWKNHVIDEELYCTQIYEWSEGAEPQQGNDLTIDISYKEHMPEWEETLVKNMCINNKVSSMSPASQMQLMPQGILSIFIAPVFLKGTFWGFIGFDDCHSERVFSDNEEMILRSAGLLIANSMLKNEMTVSIKSSADQLAVALEQAQAANKAKSNFLSNMSHEIRTPMNAIIGMGELLMTEKLTDRQRGYVDDIVVSSKALLGIINDILDFSKIESGKQELNPIDYDFNLFIDHIKSIFIYIIQKKGLDFKVECGDNLPQILYGDELRLRQALTNILGNAVKFTEKGYVCLNVSVSNGMLIFKVIDTGIGIHKEDLPKIFKAFEQVDKNKNRNIIGTGLGLAISKSFIEMMGGSITLESNYGFGTVFTILIPIVLGNKERLECNTVTCENNMVCVPGVRVLVVDDNEFNLRVASGLLALMEVEAEIVDSGIKSIDLVRHNDYDIVFMDHMMPEMDGIETVEIIRSFGKKYEKMTIIALTANAVTGAKEMFLQKGFNDFISKPINARDLHAMVQKHLPPDKLRLASRDEGQHAGTDKEEQLRRDSILSFYKDNQDTFVHITDSLGSGDLKTAHRIAHTLKSNAGYLGKTALQQAASSLEQSLQNEPPEYDARQVGQIGLELEKVLTEFGPMVAALKAEKPTAVRMERGQLESLLTQLRPLLEKSDFNAVDIAKQLENVAGMENLAERIDEYDFDGALQILNNYKMK